MKHKTIKMNQTVTIKTNDVAGKKAMHYPVKSLTDNLVVKDVDLTKRIVTGLFNSFNYFDSDYDVIRPGSAQKSISERGPDSSAVGKIKHLAYHDWTKGVGKIQVLQEKTVTINNQKVKGIYFETKMSSTSLGTDTLINYQDGVLDNHSIGFRFLDGEWKDEDSEDWLTAIADVINYDEIKQAGMAYFWSEIKLYEGSSVALGANQLTPFLGVKDATNKDVVALKLMDRLNRLETALKSGTQTDETLELFAMETLQLKQLISELFMERPSEKPTRESRENKDTPEVETKESIFSKLQIV